MAHAWKNSLTPNEYNVLVLCDRRTNTDEDRTEEAIVSEAFEYDIRPIKVLQSLRSLETNGFMVKEEVNQQFNLTERGSAYLNFRNINCDLPISIASKLQYRTNLIHNIMTTATKDCVIRCKNNNFVNVDSIVLKQCSVKMEETIAKQQERRFLRISDTTSYINVENVSQRALNSFKFYLYFQTLEIDLSIMIELLQLAIELDFNSLIKHATEFAAENLAVDNLKALVKFYPFTENNQLRQKTVALIRTNMSLLSDVDFYTRVVNIYPLGIQIFHQSNTSKV